MRKDIDLNCFKKRLEERLKEITATKKTVSPLELDQSRVGRLSRMGISGRFVGYSVLKSQLS